LKRAAIRRYFISMMICAAPLERAPLRPLLTPVPMPAPAFRQSARRAGRTLATAGLIAGLAAVVAWAEAAVQDWIPEVLEFPSDAEVVTDREIGSTVRMFSVTTGEDTGALLTDWEEALRTGGYAIERESDELVEGAIEFSGPGIANAKIAATRRAADGQTLIEFDATLD
jgi:hypothetical protein